MIKYTYIMPKQEKAVNYDALVKSTERLLNASYAQFNSAIAGPRKDFAELKLQAAIFQYDISSEMAAITRKQATGFAKVVALKGLLLRLFEYKLRLQHMTPKIEQLMVKGGGLIEREEKRKLRVRFQDSLIQLERWSGVRNNAAGHYGNDFSLQISSLESLDYEQVMHVAIGFLGYNKVWVKFLRDAAWGDFVDGYPVE